MSLNKVINDLTTRLCDMHSATMECVSDLSKLIHNLNDNVSRLEQDISALKLDKHASDNAASEMKVKISTYIVENEKLQAQYRYIEEENANLVKVSQIIAYEKENAKLKLQLLQLQNMITSAVPKEIEQTEEDQDITLYEKRIDKIMYFISDDEDKRVFIRTSQGDVGDEIGRLVILNGKQSVQLNVIKDQT